MFLKSEKGLVTNVRYSSPTNSTKFTCCCGIAVIRNRDGKCPECNAKIEWNLN